MGQAVRVVAPVKTSYVMVDGCEIAYQVHGSGPVDLLFIDGWIRGAETDWDDPAYGRMLRRYGQFARVIRFDGRGSGMSDPDPTGRWSVLDASARDASGVLDAVGSERCAVYETASGVPSPSGSRRYPDRVDALVLDTTWARLRRAPDQPFGMSDRAVERSVEAIRLRWGDGVMVDIVGLGHDEVTRAEEARQERLNASRGVAALLMRACFEADVRTDLAEIDAPTLVVHRHGPTLDVGHGRALASGIRGAIFEEVTHEDWSLIGETDDHPPGWIRIVEFLTGVRHEADPDRVFATVLFTDIVGSTTTVADMGDGKWKPLVDAHDAESARQVRRFGGRIVTWRGDGVLATFSSPSQALECASEIRQAIMARGIGLRIGLHAAEIELSGEQVAGIGVHIGARVSDIAEAGEILVTNTVRQLVTGSRFSFTEHGNHTLKGVPGRWDLFRLTDE